MSTKYIDAVLRLKDDFSSTLTKVEGSLKSFKSKAGAMEQSFYNTSKGMQGIGKAMMPVTLAVGAGVAASIKSYSNLETALVKVRKTTDLNNKEFAKFSDDIVKMSRRIPESAENIAKVAEAAGQLGVSKEHLVDFTETMVKMGTATNMSAEDAATAAARFAAITGMSEKDYGRLGSTVVALGNNFATTESEIMEMGLRLAGTAHQIGMTESSTMSLAAAMSSVGIQAEAGGSAMSKIMTKINRSVFDGGKNLQNYASVAGVSADKFASVWRSEPAKALAMVAKGLDDVNRSGGNVDAVLDSLNIKGIREVDTMKRLSGAHELLSRSIKLGARAWKENEALNKEAAAAYKTFEAKVRFLKNALQEVAKAVAVNVLPMLSPLIDKVTELAYNFADAEGDTQRFILKLVGFAAAIGPVALGIGKIIGLANSAVKVGMKLGSAIEGGSTLMGAILTPGVQLALVLAGIALAAGLIIANWDKIGPVIENVKNKFLEFVESSPLLQGFVDMVSSVAERIKGFIEPLKGFFGQLKEHLGGFFSSLGGLFGAAFGVISELVATFATPIVAAFDLILAAIGQIAPFVGQYILYIIDQAKALVDFVTNVLTGNWAGAWNAVKTMFSNTVNLLKGWFDTLKSKLETPIKGAVDMVYDKFKAGVDKVKKWWGEVKAFLRHPIRGTVNIMRNIMGGGDIGRNARGTSNWKGGLTWVGEEGPEIVNLPRGSEVLSNTKSRLAMHEARMSGNPGGDTHIHIPKLADQIVVREDADIDRIGDALYRKLKIAKLNQAKPAF